MSPEIIVGLICVGVPAVLLGFIGGLVKLGPAAGLFAFMATAVALVLMWPLGLLFMVAVCCCAMTDSRPEAAR